MKKSIFCTTALCALSLATAPAFAQEQSVFDRERSDYESEGIHAGAFYVKPGIEVKEYFNDNIFATETAEVDDYITVISPSITARSDWSRHQLNFKAQSDSGIYADNDDENYNDFHVGGDLRLDVLRETFITGALSYDKKHEDRGSPDDANGAEPTEYDETKASLGFFRGLRRFSVKLDNEYTNLDYDDAFTGTGTVIDNDDRDRDEYQVSLRLGYEIIPNYEAFIRGTYDIRTYDETTTIDRDSDGYEVVGGTAINLGGKTRGEIYAGYITREIDAAALPDIEEVSFGANLLWNPTGLTSIKTGIVRGVEETTDNNASGYLATTYFANVEHELLRNVLLGANANFTTNEYEGAAAGQDEREDEILGLGGELRYLLNRKFHIAATYDYNDRDSNLVNQDYSSNIVMLKFGLSM